jgi:hypothetical protein
MAIEYVKNSKYYDVSHYDIFSIKGVSNLLVGVTLFSIFLGIFYFTYASNIENDILKIQIKNLVDSFTNDLNNLNITNINSEIYTVIDNFKIPDMSAEDKKVKDDNNKLMIKSLKLFGILTISCVFFITTMFVIYKIDLKNIIITNCIILVFVAITEIFFLNMVAKRYNSLDVNSIKTTIVENIIDLQNI